MLGDGVGMAQAENLKLPSGFVTVRDVLDGKYKVGNKVSCCGIVTDFRAPIRTNGPGENAP